AVAENEAAIEDRDLRLFDRQEFAVQEDRVSLHLNHSLSVSHARPSRPAGATLSRDTTGKSADGLPSKVTRSAPICAPRASGAIRGCCDTSSAFSFSFSPFGTVTSSSCCEPTRISFTAPFHTCTDFTASFAP